MNDENSHQVCSQSFQEYITILELFLSPNLSPETFEYCFLHIFNDPKSFEYCMQIYEQKFTRFFPVAPKIMEKFFGQYKAPQLRIIVNNDPTIISRITNIVLDFETYDSQFSHIFYTILNLSDPSLNALAEVTNILFSKMIERLSNISNIKIFKMGIGLFPIISTLMRKTCSPIVDETILEKLRIINQFLISYCNVENFENESYTPMNMTLIQNVTLLVRFYFPFFSEDMVFFNNIFNLLHIFIQKNIEKSTPTISKAVTDVFINFSAVLNELISWIYFQAPDFSRFSNERACVKAIFDNYFNPLCDAALILPQLFPYDFNRQIAYNILYIIYTIFSNADDNISLNLDKLYSIALIYSNLTAEMQNQYIENPIVFYHISYCFAGVSIYDPRSFSIWTIKILFQLNQEITLNLLNQSPPSSGLMILYGQVAELAKEYENCGQIVESILPKILSLVRDHQFIPDKLFLLSQVSYMLNDDFLNSMCSSLGTLFRIDFSNISADDIFNFTLGCNIMKSLLMNNSVKNDNNKMLFLGQHIGIIIENARFCITDDAISCATAFLTRDEDLLIQNAENLLLLNINQILYLTNYFTECSDDLNKYDTNKYNSYFENIIQFAKIAHSIPTEIIKNFIEAYLKTEYQISDINKFINSFIEKRYEGLFDIIAFYFDRIIKKDFADFTENEVFVFINLITQMPDVFMTWNQKDDIVKHFLKKLQKYNRSNDPADIYFIVQLIALFILFDMLPDCENTMNQLLEIAVNRLKYVNEKAENLYVCFDLISSIIIKRPDTNINQNDMQMWLQMISKGFVFRDSEIIRYSYAIKILEGRFNEEERQGIDTLLNALKQNQIPPASVENWFTDQSNIGISNPQLLVNLFNI